MLCPNCRTQNLPGSNFCALCAAPLASAQPPQSTSTSNKSKYALIAIGGVFLAFILVCGACGLLFRKVEQAEKKQSIAVAEQIATQSPTPPLSAWTYNTTEDQMTGKETRTAEVISENTASFNFPYNGEQHATLRVINHPRFGKNVTLAIERGQFLAATIGGSVTVRFDESAPVKFWATGASDSSTETLFLNNYSKFISSLRKAKVVRMSTEVYNEGTPVFVFHVGGLEGF